MTSMTGYAYEEKSGDTAVVSVEIKSVNSRFYKNAINVWTVRDTNKRQTAILNNLNYKELWSMKEAIEYINFLSAS